MDGQKSAKAECDSGESAAPLRELEASTVCIGCGYECHVVQPHRQAIRRRDIENAIQDQVRRIERGDVAFGDERDAEPEAVAPEGSSPAARLRESSLLSGR